MKARVVEFVAVLARGDEWLRPVELVLDCGDYVWVRACAGGNPSGRNPEIVRVADDRSTGRDEDGCAVYSVPAEWCAFLSAEEAAAAFGALEGAS